MQFSARSFTIATAWLLQIIFSFGLLTDMSFGMPHKTNQLSENETTEPIKISSLNGEPLGLHMEILKDPNGSFTLQDVLSPSMVNQWQKSSEVVPNFAITNDTIWVRFKIHNNYDTEKTYVLDVGYAALQKVGLYYLKNAELLYKSEIGGQVFDNRPIDGPGFPFPINLQPGTSDVYLRVFSPYHTLQIPVILQTEKEFRNYQRTMSTLGGIYFGVIISMLIYNLFLYLILKVRDFLYYVQFNFIQLLFQIGISGAGFEYLWPEYPGWEAVNCLFLVPAVVVFSRAFVLNFLAEKSTKAIRRVRIAHNILWGVEIIAIITALFHRTEALSAIIIATAIIFCILNWVLAIQNVMAGFKPAKYFAFAWSLFLWGTVIRACNKLGLLPFNMFTELAQPVGSMVEMIVLSFALGDKMNYEKLLNERKIENLNEILTKKVSEVGKLNHELKNYAQRVENLVEEKTREISSIMKNIKQGIFTIVKGPAFGKHYSKHLEILLGQRNLQNKNPVDVLLSQTNLSHDKISIVRSILTIGLEDNLVNFQFNHSNLPKKITYQAQYFEIEWQPIPDKTGNLEKILVVVRDVTKIKALEEDNKAQKSELNRINEILSTPLESYQKFIAESDRFLTENQTLIENNSQFRENDLKMVFINFHSIKGIARSIKFSDLVDTLHAVESYCSLVLKNPNQWDHSKMIAANKKAKDSLKSYSILGEKKLGRHNNPGICFSKDIVLKILDIIPQEPQHIGLFKHLYRSYYKRSKEVFHDIFSQASRLAHDLGKEAPQIIISGANADISPKGIDFLEKVFVHLIRNAIDHSIENTATRIAAGKDPKPKLHLTITIDGDELIISFKDDGQGLRLKTIKEIGVKHDLIKEDEGDHNRIAQLIFQSGFSTTTAVSEISGRGVGMSAVQKYVIQDRAAIEIRFLNPVVYLDDSSPIEFQLKLPNSMFNDKKTVA